MRGRAARGWAAIILIPILLVGISLYAKDLTMTEWNRVVKYHSPYLYDLPPGKVSAPLSSQVVVIVGDGLRVDMSKQLSSYNRLRQLGADMIATTGQPSLSDPGAAVIASGTYQELHGVTTNWYEGLLKVDSIVAAAKRAGLRTGVAGGKGYQQLHGSNIDVGKFFDWYDTDPTRYDNDVEKASKELLAMDPKVNFFFVHYSATDNMAHEYGGVSKEYTKAAQDIDKHIQNFLASVDLTKTTVILTADHGHIDTGGHGGWESVVTHVPLVMAGPGIKPGKYGTVGQGDIAPTVAALLGAPIPEHATGRVLDETLNATDEIMASILLKEAEQKQAFYTKYLATLGAAAGSSKAADDHLKAAQGAAATKNWKTAISEAKAERTAFAVAASGARTGKLQGERAGRLPAVAALIVVPALLLWLLGRKRSLGVAIGAAVAYFVVYNLLFFGVHHYALSLSSFNEESLIQAYFNQRMLEAAVSVLLAAAVYGVVEGRSGAGGLELASGGALVSGLVWYGLLLQVLLMVYLYGLKFDWMIPDLKIGFKFYLDMLQMVATGLAAVAVPLVAVGAGLVGRATAARGGEKTWGRLT